MIKRSIEPLLKEKSLHYPVQVILGPRQSGKTTLARQCFPDFQYMSLEDPDVRLQAKQDPRGLLSSTKDFILDEIQNVPELLSYIQTIVDDPKNKRKFILTGSHQINLHEAVSQSLAGRARLFYLLPLTWKEMKLAGMSYSIEELVIQGAYPRIYDLKLNAYEWLAQYFQTYVEKDIRSITKITDFFAFEKLLRLLAGHCSQLLNYSNIATDVGVSSATIQAWTRLLEISFVGFLLQPYHNNFNKRVVKTPKFYFYDTGLLCFLLGIKTVEHLKQHPLKGQIIENWFVAELMKQEFHKGELPRYYFWRDSQGHEVDLVKEENNSLKLIEFKAGQTFQPEWVQNIQYLNGLQKTNGGQLYYLGENEKTFQDIKVIPWALIGQ